MELLDESLIKLQEGCLERTFEGIPEGTSKQIPGGIPGEIIEGIPRKTSLKEFLQKPSKVLLKSFRKEFLEKA